MGISFQCAVQHLAGRTDSPSPGHPTYQCNSHENTEYWGDVVMWGHDHKIPTAEGCCSACQQYEPTIDVLKGAQCNIWVWHPELHECWLKYIPDVSQPAVQSKGPQTPWTSGMRFATADFALKLVFACTFLYTSPHRTDSFHDICIGRMHPRARASMQHEAQRVVSVTKAVESTCR